MPRRVISYVDGFNLYFGLRDANYKRYYWLDFEQLTRSFLKPDQQYVACKYFTARIRNSSGSQNAKRQSIWLDAVGTNSSIELHYGHYLRKPKSCKNCSASWQEPEEKMTDVNIASHLLLDAFQDRFDTAIVVSGDSDLTTPIRMVREQFPDKRVIVAFPPKRNSSALRRVATGHFKIGEDKLRHSQLPESIALPNGYELTRPPSWR